jgi:hypothetical protein
MWRKATPHDHGRSVLRCFVFGNVTS